jgi:hypothetical protein
MPEEETTDAPETQDDTDAPDPKNNADELPQWARDQLAQARKDAAKYRTKAKELEPLAAKAKELEDAGKSESEKLTGRLTEAEKRAQAAEERALRLQVAHDKGLTPAQAKRLVGATQEELEADADELLAEFSPKESEDDPKRRPRERLRSGATPEVDDEPDLDAAAERVRRF